MSSTLNGILKNSIESLVSSLQTNTQSSAETETEDADDHNAIDILRILRDESSKLFELQQLRDAIDTDVFGAFSTPDDDDDDENDENDNDNDEEPNNKPLPGQTPKPKLIYPEIVWLKRNISIVSISRDSALLEDGASCSIIRAVLELRKKEEVLRLVCCYERMPSRRGSLKDGDGDGSSSGSTSTTSEELALLFRGPLNDSLSDASQNSRESPDGPFADGDNDDVTADDDDDDPSAESKEENVPDLKLLKRKRQDNTTKVEEPITTHKRCKATKSDAGSSDGDDTSSSNGDSSDQSPINHRTSSRGGNDGSNSTRISYTIDVSQNHGPLERLIDIHVNAPGQCPSSEPALPMEEEEAQNYMQGLPSMDDDSNDDDDDSLDDSRRREDYENDSSWQDSVKDVDVRNRIANGMKQSNNHRDDDLTINKPSNKEKQEANDESDSDLQNDTRNFLATHAPQSKTVPPPNTDTFCAGINPAVLHDFVKFCSSNTTKVIQSA
eukprot:CAMPEP_0194373990 /NCGR_PEP_ID=MMETSP0174-20130528/22358_1 /TAXON_ID=216777 /ORGANISM="Proboscia alata, Strain PI-D3" /LENGTH=496 /DNA_ID=CAMNT_0039153303 /DNA_START=31 /DNA_END=1517 /DNA_ORIENTATION=+